MKRMLLNMLESLLTGTALFFFAGWLWEVWPTPMECFIFYSLHVAIVDLRKDINGW